MTRITAITLIVLGTACGRSSARKTTVGATLEGTVLTTSPANLSVNVPGTASAARTDASGHFALIHVPAGAAALHFSGTGVDATLPIAALSEGEHRSIRVEVSGHDAREHHEESEAELRGAIESIAAPAFVVAGRTVNTTTGTVFQKKGAAIAFADLNVGDNVEVEGALQADGTLLARSVRVEDAPEPADAGTDDGGAAEGVEFSGTLTAIDGSKLTVGSTTVAIDGSTRIEKADQIIAASELAIGDQLRVEGTLQADSSVLATEIRVLTATEQAQVLIAGTVASVSTADQSFTVGESLIHVDAHTSFSGQDSFASLADLHAGDSVDVEAAKQADGSLLAISVHRLERPDENEVEVKGAIEQLGTSSLQVQGKMFAVDASTDIRQEGNTVQFSSLKLGQVAEVRGMAAADGSLRATRISLESGH
jgi:hypothetical protein